MLSGFHWIMEHKMAGSGMPGVYEEEQEGLSYLQEQKVTHVISLIEDNPEEVFKKIDVVHRHFPIIDMGVPEVNPLKKLLKEMVTFMNEGGTVLVHCKAGMGRTGVVLASYLVYKGMKAERAIELIRKINPGYIQNSVQERFVKLFALAS